MGIPAFFRWLADKYPRVVCPVSEDKDDNDDDEQECIRGDGDESQALNASRASSESQAFNPSRASSESETSSESQAFDCLYLDMNGIIHPCCHPVDKEAPPDEPSMMLAVFRYMDRIVRLVRPRKLLYLAIDGVAPRAKMNQQRSRRFRAALDAQSQKSQSEHFASDDTHHPKAPWDSNVITPGTPFMAKLSEALRYHIQYKLSTDPVWQRLQVIFSDAQVPGEGEHKLMRFVRLQRAQPGYDPNTRHCIYGMDADLIMLSLATHEPHFTIVREQIADMIQDKKNANAPKEKQAFLYVHLHVLREYLARELALPAGGALLPFAYDFECVLDDWIFLCFFVGNDFLPPLPSLEIREGAIDTLIELYKRLLPALGGYLFDGVRGELRLDRIAVLLSEVGRLENGIFRERRQREERQRRHRRQLTLEEHERPYADRAAQTAQQVARNMWMSTHSTDAKDIVVATTERQDSQDSNKCTDAEPPDDAVRMGDSGWKQRYYLTKLGLDPGKAQHQPHLRQMFKSYAAGLCWVMRYYYHGCPDWAWFYPYHYAPAASDLSHVDEYTREIVFDADSRPFAPLTQLMAVLPAASAHCMPDALAQLMTSPESPILDFYPERFALDLNGKKYSWQAVALLPFIDEKRLLSSVAHVTHQLSDPDQRRNAVGHDHLFVYEHHASARTLQHLYANAVSAAPLSDGVCGMVQPDPHAVQPGQALAPPFEHPELDRLRQAHTFAAIYLDPPTCRHQSELLPGLHLPPPVLRERDLAHHATVDRRRVPASFQPNGPRTRVPLPPPPLRWNEPHPATRRLFRPNPNQHSMRPPHRNEAQGLWHPAVHGDKPRGFLHRGTRHMDDAVDPYIAQAPAESATAFSTHRPSYAHPQPASLTPPDALSTACSSSSIAWDPIRSGQHGVTTYGSASGPVHGRTALSHASDSDDGAASNASTFRQASESTRISAASSNRGFPIPKPRQDALVRGNVTSGHSHPVRPVDQRTTHDQDPNSYHARALRRCRNAHSSQLNPSVV